MKGKISILFIVLIHLVTQKIHAQQSVVSLEFCGQQLDFSLDNSNEQYAINSLSAEGVIAFYQNILAGNYEPAIRSLKSYKEKYNPDDWLFYQLVRRTSQHISPKEKNYYQYTAYKWFLLTQAGYDAILTISVDKILFYVQCDENIYNIPYRRKNGRQYVCLNYHDYGTIDFVKEHFTEIPLPSSPSEKTFSYRVSRIPDFHAAEYLEKDLHFTYKENDYQFKIKLTSQVQKLFANYPVVDYDSYLNIPLSNETYNSLIPQLRKSVKGMKIKNGVDFIMRFTRYAFLFEPDTEHFGGEKRLSPEQTLFYDQSDCEDRVALFFCLVKEIYNLPMIVISFPKHVTIAVQFDKTRGKTIVYNGEKYSICDPTPQKTDLPIGKSLAKLHEAPYEIVYHYSPF